MNSKILSDRTYLLFFLAILVFICSPETTAQQLHNANQYEISYGKGNSLYEEIICDQSIFSVKIPHVSENIGNMSFESNINFEILAENSNKFYLAGFQPALRYDFDLFDTQFFFKGGVGFNYITTKYIGTRKLGGNFIFSDLLGIGTRLFSIQTLDVELTYLFRHISNAGIYKHNDGYNSHYVIFTFLISR